MPAIAASGPGNTARASNVGGRAALAVSALAILCYVNAIDGEFVFDDIKLIVNNDIVKDPGRVGEVLFTNLWGLLGRGSNYYRPLPPLLFMGLHALFGLRPEPFHLLSIALHAGTTCLVFLTARALLEGHAAPARALWGAVAGAVIFAVHPIHVEAVAWISGVMDVACTFFSLLAIYLYITADAARRRSTREALSLVALSLALLSKEPAAVVPFVLMAYDLLFGRSRLANARIVLRRWAPPFAVLAGYLALRAFSLGGVAPFRQEGLASTSEMALSLSRLFALYLQKLVLPVNLNVVYDLPAVTTPTAPEFLLAVVTLAIFVAVGWLALRVRGTAAFGLLLFLLTLAPSLYVPALSQDLTKAFAERYAYFPSAGLALMLAAACTGAQRQGVWVFRAVLAGLAAISVTFGGLTLARNRVWQDSLALWSDCVRKSPNLALAHENLGLALLRSGAEEEGRRSLQTALRLAPELAENAVTSGVLAARKGLTLQAILSFQTALLHKPGLVLAHYNLALAFEQLGWNDAAILEYRATLATDASHADAHNNLGVLLAQVHRIDDAVGHFEAAVRARPADPELRLNLARAYEIKGLTARAAEQRSLAALRDSVGKAVGSRQAPQRSP